MRGLDEGWFPEIAPPHVPSEQIYGTCDEIYTHTTNTTEIVHEYPGDNVYWRGPFANESIVIVPKDHHHHGGRWHFGNSIQGVWMLWVCLLLVGFFGWRRYSTRCHKKWQYTEIDS